MKVTPLLIDIPDDCGDFCPIMKSAGYKFPLSYQGDDCSRCPLFNCPDLIEPEGYSSTLINYYLYLWSL